MKRHQTAIIAAIILTLSAVAAFALPNYTGFTNRATGYVVTAATWNSEFGNLITHVNTYCIGTLNLLLTKGNLLSSDGTTIHALSNSGAVDDGKVLTLNSGAVDGLAWTAPAGQIIENSNCAGRLTAQTNTPVMTSSSTLVTTIFFTPFGGNTIDLYESSQWHKHTFAEISIPLAGLLIDRNYDVFIYDSDANDTADASDLVIWTDASTRATALARQDGVYVKTAATSRRYVGSVRMSATGALTYDSTERFIWNYYNRVETFGIVGLTTDSWTYATNTWRRINGFDAKCELIVGVEEEVVNLDYFALASGTGDSAVGIGIDQFTSNDADIFTEHKNSTSSEYETPSAHKYLPLDEGYHQIYALEKAITGTTTFYGDDGGEAQAGMKVTLRM